MSDTADYIQTLSDALRARADWLEKSELPKLKESLRFFQTGFASLYNLYLKKRLIAEDPYKQEVKIGELEVPDSGPFIEAKKLEQLSLRLSAYDTQMDFLVNFYQFSPDFLTLDRLKRIANLVKFIDWPRLTPDSQLPNTRVVAEMTVQIKTGTDALTMSVISESLSNLTKQYNPIMGYLKILVDYRRELFKLELRESALSGMPAQEAAQPALIKKKWSQANPGQPFFPDLAEEAVKEDFSGEGPALREKVLAGLKTADTKPKTVRQPVSFKTVLLDGIQSAGSTAQTFSDIFTKVSENQELLENRRKNFWGKLAAVFRKMLNKAPEAVVYELQYMDPIKNVPIRERLDINVFKAELEKKVRILSSIASKGAGFSKLETMQDEQLISFLEKTVRELQSLHKTLSALDDYFKAEASREEQDKVKGIKPDLAVIKNAIIRANAKRHEYSAKKEEEEQLKKLGVKPET